MRITCLVENTVGSAGCGAAHGLCLHIKTPTHRLLLELPSMFDTCHCTGLPAYEIMKSIMGPRLQYLHCGDGIAI